MSGVGGSGAANFANTYPGAADSVNANANDGWGNAVGSSEVICQIGVTPTDYYIELEDETGVILLEDDSKILLEIS